MGKKAIAFIFVALMLCSIFGGAVVSAAGNKVSDPSVSASLKGDKIVVKINPGSIDKFKIQIVDVTNRKKLTSKDVTGNFGKLEYYIDWSKLAFGPNKIYVGILCADSNKNNNWVYLTVVKKQDAKIDKVEGKKEGGIGYVRVTFSCPNGGTLHIWHNGYVAHEEHYKSSKEKIVTDWIPSKYQLTGNRNNVFDIFLEPNNGDVNMKNNYDAVVIIK